MEWFAVPPSHTQTKKALTIFDKFPLNGISAGHACQSCEQRKARETISRKN
jgi:hypothetical protein